jgi:hypothetical protein
VATYSCLIARTTTGEVLDELPMSDFTWTDSLDLSRTGTMTITCPLQADNLITENSNQVRARSVAGAHWYLSLVLCRNNQPLWAGPVVTHDVAADRSTIQFGCTSIAKVFDARTVLTAGFELTPLATGADVSYSLDPFSTARALLLLGSTGTGRTLPLNLPAATSPVVIDTVRTYTAADLASVLERLTQLSEEAGGPDIRFTAVLDSFQRNLSWTVDIGNPRLGLVTSPWAWDFPTSITSIAEVGDSSGMAFRGYVTGNSAGSSDTPMVGVAQDLTYTARGWPMLERSAEQTAAVPSVASVTEQPVLDRQAAAFVTANMVPARTWTIEVDPESFPEIGTWALGDNALFAVTDDSWIVDGVYPQRLIGVTHTLASASLETTSVLVSP